MQSSECRMRMAGWTRALRVPALSVLLAALSLSLAACGSKARAQTLPDGPPLAVPAAPAHEIAVEQLAEAPPAEPPPPPQPVAPVASPAAAATRTQRPDTKETPAPATVQAPAPQAPAETPAVRATASAADEQKVRALLVRASTDLNSRVDYKRLTSEGKAQYEQSKRFSDQALQAIKERNFVYALTLAEKAADIAAQLVR